MSHRARAIQSVNQSSQVQTIADYAKLSLSNDRPIMLAVKKFVPCYAAALCIKTLLCCAPHKAYSRTGIRTWLFPSLEGAVHPEKVVIVGAHLDSWDLGTGATDDGFGAAAVLGAAQALVRTGLRPARTLRFMLFTGEEEGLLGSRA